MSVFKFKRRKVGGHWVKTIHRGWITQELYSTYVAYGFDPIITEEEYYKTDAEKQEAIDAAVKLEQRIKLL